MLKKRFPFRTPRCLDLYLEHLKVRDITKSRSSALQNNTGNFRILFYLKIRALRTYHKQPPYIIFIQQQQQRYDNDSPTQSSPMSSSEISSSASYTLLSAQNEQGPLPAFIRTSKTHPHTKSLRKCDPVSR